MNIKHASLQVLGATVLLSLTHSAAALSCRPGSVVQRCKHMQEQKQSPIFANGQLTLKKVISRTPLPPLPGGRHTGKGEAVADYLFSGTITDKSGKREVRNAPLRVSSSCAASWCASLPSDKESGYFFFESKGDAAMALDLGPCSPAPFYDVTPQQVKAVEACLLPGQIKAPTPTQVPLPPKPVNTSKPITTKPVETKPIEQPKQVKNRGAGQIYSQHSKDKKLVE